MMVDAIERQCMKRKCPQIKRKYPQIELLAEDDTVVFRFGPGVLNEVRFCLLKDDTETYCIEVQGGRRITIHPRATNVVRILA